MTSTNPSAPNINVPIRIEPTDEYKIQEISYDGQEKYIPPLSMSENLAQLIRKIDFNQPIDELKKELEAHQSTDTEDQDETPESKKQTTTTQLQSCSSWPFESMRAKLRLALTEICVLNDVLSIAKDKKYMIFDTVNPTPSDQRPIVGLLARKRAFQTAAQILLEGVASLRASHLEPSDTTSFWRNQSSLDQSMTSSSNLSLLENLPEPNFYEELKEMRRSWVLKRIGNNIIGDLSYFRPFGYRFGPATRFDVVKTGPGSRGPNNQALSVKIPADLQGRAHIQVSIIKSDEISLVDLSTAANGRCYEAVKDCSWQEKLESAQNILICKELFCHLASQATQYQHVTPTTVTGNQIILALFPEVKLYITLVHFTPNTKGSREITEGMKKLRKEHRPVLEHSLHQIFKDFYAVMFRKMQGIDTPREAGPSAMDRQTLFELTRQESSLDKIVNQAQHLIMRQQTMNVIDSFAAKIKDPLIISHWFCLNSPTTSIVRVDIVSHNNEILGRSHMLIYIGTRRLRVITRDCKNLLLGYEPDELQHLLIWQSCLHQFIASDKLSKLLGWYTLNLNYSVNVTRQEMSSNAFSLVMCSSNCTHMISIKSGPQFGLAVDVAQFREPSNLNVNQLQQNGYDLHDRESVESMLGLNGNGYGAASNKLCKLSDLVDNFREVDWDKMQGRDFLTKLELLMAALTELR